MPFLNMYICVSIGIHMYQSNFKVSVLIFQVNGQEANVIASKCNSNGIRILKFSKPNGPVFHYKSATNISFGDQPHLREPLDKKYVNVKKSKVATGQGVFAARDIPANTSVTIYGGYLYDEEQMKIWGINLHEKYDKYDKSLVADWWHSKNPLIEMETRYLIELISPDLLR